MLEQRSTDWRMSEETHTRLAQAHPLLTLAPQRDDKRNGQLSAQNGLFVEPTPPILGLFCPAIFASPCPPSSADNLVAMEALLDRLSVLGYDNALRNENKPPLSR